MLRLLNVPHGVQLRPNENFGHPFLWNSFMAPLVRLLGESRAIGPRGAAALYQFQWPAFLPKEADWQWLYVARAPSAGIVKIGLSSDPVQRMLSLRTAIPKSAEAHDFELLGALPRCSRAHEKALCCLFADSLHSGKEWFTENPATRALCYHVVRQRDCADASNRAFWLFHQMVEGLRYVCLGRIPYRLSGGRCGICQSVRHNRRTCPERKAA